MPEETIDKEDDVAQPEDIHSFPVNLPSPDFPIELGNHRMVVQVNNYQPVVRVNLPWRCPRNVQGVTVIDAVTGKIINNIIIIALNKDQGDIAFEPVTGPGDYYIYYRAPYPTIPKADKKWVHQHQLSKLQDKNWKRLPRATFVRFESACKFDEFTIMEHLATVAEVEQLISEHPDHSYLIFSEDRKLPIRMQESIPLHWVQRQPTGRFRGIASPNEFYTFQVGVFAIKQDIEDLEVLFEDLIPVDGEGLIIPKTAFTCFNTGGTDWKGQPFKKTIRVKRNTVQALWIGVDIPAEAQGQYHGKISIVPKDHLSSHIKLELDISGPLLADKGDSDLWRHARLRWLNSTIGFDDHPAMPFTPIKTEEEKLILLGREIMLSASGLPCSIGSKFAPDNMSLVDKTRDILAGPIEFLVESCTGKLTPFLGREVEFISKTDEVISWKSQSTVDDLQLSCEGRLEYDGYLEYQIKVTAEKTTKVRDIQLVLPMHRDVAMYMMGLGRQGGFRPHTYHWKWDKMLHQDSVWLGDVNAGLRCQWFDQNYQRPIIIEGQPTEMNLPPSWQNQGRGGVLVDEADDRVLLRAFSGSRTIAIGETLNFNFNLLITPFKTIDPVKHWKNRYYHESTHYPTTDFVTQAGVNIVNLHQGNDLNPYINYPFHTTNALAKYVKSMHDCNVGVKLYYTVRELSTRVHEMWALRSLGDEVFVPGPGGGHQWMLDHLDADKGSGYVPAWTAVLSDGSLDTSITTTMLSRWHNYYIEGLRWLLEEIEIDGIYLDGIGYDRDVMQRVRKVMDKTRPGSLIDWHNGNTFQPQYGLSSPALRYMDLMPYVDSLWFGEMFEYNNAPDYWLIEISGIPFGLMGDMINGHRFYGTVYGMTSRLGWAWGDNVPTAVWKMWDEFGIEQSQMIGYWVNECPVKVNHPKVYVTVYRKPSRSMIAVANWNEEAIDCHLEIEFSSLGIDPKKAHLYSMAIEGFQPERTFALDELIPIDSGQAWLLILEEQK